MEVRKKKAYTGLYTYEVSNSRYVRVAPPYTAGSSFWNIMIPDIGDRASRSISIYSASTLSQIKEVLGRFNSEEELLGVYYKARIEGRYHLDEARGII